MKKKIAFLIVISIMIILITGVAFADSITQRIELLFNTVKLMSYGQEYETHSISYNGKLYIPLDTVEDILNREIDIIVDNEPIQTTDNTNNSDLTNISSALDLKQYLIKNYSTLKTVIGTTNFTFDIYENESTLTSYDYWIQVDYEYDFFGGAMYSTKYNSDQKQALKIQLKSHMEKLAKDIIKRIPDKKLYGGYYKSWYEYPTIQVGFEARRYYSWTNYNEPIYLSDISIYEQTKPSSFRWYPDIDDDL